MSTTYKRKHLVDGLVFPEAPRWYQDRLWLSDQHTHRVLRVDLDGRVEVIVQLDDMPSGLGFLPDGTPLVASMRKRQVLRIENGKLTIHADLQPIRDGWLNDMVVDGNGRAYVGLRRGRYAYPEPNDEPESLVLIGRDGRYHVVADDVTRPNGAAISPDGKTLVLVEAKCLTAYTIDEDGSLSGRRIFANLEDYPGDGMCIDAEGAVWFASPAARAFMRVRDGGEITDSIPAGDRWAIACALGGRDRQTLFLLTIKTTRENLVSLQDAKADARSQSEGWVETTQVSVPGAGWP